MPMNFDKEYQTRFNGPLTVTVRDRIKSFNKSASWAEIGKALGLSGTFSKRIVIDGENIRSKHIPRIRLALETAEHDRDNDTDKTTETFHPPTTDETQDRTDRKELSLEQLVEAITAKGYNCTVEAKAQ